MNAYIEVQRKVTDRHLQKLGSTKLLNRYKTSFDKLRPYLRSGMRLLDVGGREGSFGKYISNFVDIRYDVLDVSYNAVKTVPGIVGDCHIIPFKDCCFNIVTMLHTLEHCYSPSLVLSDISRILKINGLVYVLIPIETALKKYPTFAGHYSFFSNGVADFMKKLYGFETVGNEKDWCILRRKT